MAYYLKEKEGIFVGPSAALNVVGAVKLARHMGPGHTICTVLCDGGDRCSPLTQRLLARIDSPCSQTHGALLKVPVEDLVRGMAQGERVGAQPSETGLTCLEFCG